jgi:hypothetical protein
MWVHADCADRVPLLLLLLLLWLTVQGVNNAVLHHANHTAAKLKQEVGMVRLALLQDTTAAAGSPATAELIATAKGAGKASSSSSSSALSKAGSQSCDQQQQQQQVRCYLLPPKLPNNRKLTALATKLATAVHEAVSASRDEAAAKAARVRSLVEAHRLCKLRRSSRSGSSSGGRLASFCCGTLA